MNFKQFKTSFLYLTAFLGGVAGMMVELTAVRLVAPFFGSSMEVWATIIALVMTALALGYFFGGQLSKRIKKLDSAIYLIIALAGLLIGFSYLFVEPIVSFTSLSLHLAKFSLSLKTFLVVLSLFFLPVLLLGSIYPLIIACLKGKKSGQASGLIFAISTSGSILGTLLPSFLLIPLIGTKLTFFLTGIALEIIALIGLPKFQKIIPLSILILLLFNLPHSPRTISNLNNEIIYQTESIYQEIKVIKRENTYYLSLGPNSYSSSYSPASFLANGYYDYYNLIPLIKDFNRDLDVLIIGLGGGTMSRQYQHFFSDKYNLRIDGVEIDPEVIKVGKEYFELEQPSLTIYQMDGRAFLNQTEKKYDIIIVDVYARQTYIPFHLATQEFFQETKKHLKEHGILAFNVCSPSRKSFRHQSISQTVKSVFDYCYSLPIEVQDNFIILASDSPLKSLAEIDQEEIPEDLRSLINSVQQMRPIEFSNPNFILYDDTAPEKL